jgi:hypothetical protein
MFGLVMEYFELREMFSNYVYFGLLRTMRFQKENVEYLGLYSLPGSSEVDAHYEWL